MASTSKQQRGQAVALPSMSRGQQEMVKIAGVLLLSVSHCVLPAGHVLLLSPTIIAGMLVAQSCSAVFSLTTSHSLAASKFSKVIECEGHQLRNVDTESTTAQLSLQDWTISQAIGGFLALVVATKVLDPLGLQDSSAQWFVLALLLGSSSRSALEKGQAVCDDGNCHKGGGACSDHAPVSDDDCPYDDGFWVELQPDSRLDEHVDALADDVCMGREREVVGHQTADVGWATSHVLAPSALTKVIEREDPRSRTVDSKSSTVQLSSQGLTISKAIGGLLALAVATKGLGLLGLQGSSKLAFALALLLGSVARSVLERGGAGRESGNRRKDGCSCGLCPSGDDDAPADDDGCPYDGSFWVELQPGSQLDEHVDALAEDLVVGAEHQE